MWHLLSSAELQGGVWRPFLPPSFTFFFVWEWTGFIMNSPGTGQIWSIWGLKWQIPGCYCRGLCRGGQRIQCKAVAKVPLHVAKAPPTQSTLCSSASINTLADQALKFLKVSGTTSASPSGNIVTQTRSPSFDSHQNLQWMKSLLTLPDATYSIGLWEMGLGSKEGLSRCHQALTVERRLWSCSVAMYPCNFD